MSHAVTSPYRIVDIFKTNFGIEFLRSRITLVYKQPHLRDTQLSGFLDGSSQELLGDALATETAGNG